MQKKNMWLVAAVVVVILAVGGYAIFHKSTKSTNSTTTSSQSSIAPVNNSVILTKNISGIGQYLTDLQGNALYTYGGDTSGISNCTGSCLSNWPPYQDKGTTSNLPTSISTIKRTDNGQTQYTYNGMPLYFFASDHQGQVTGNNVQNFQVAKPVVSPQASSTPSSNNNSSSAPSYSY